MQAKKYRWSRAYESAEEELVDLLRLKDVTATRIVIEDQDELEEQKTLQAITIWCAEGSINFMVDTVRFHLQAGDTLFIPSGANFRAIAGFTGCVYYQS